MSLTQEQQTIIDRAAEIMNGDEPGLLLVNAVAGSGKTHLLTQLAKQIPHRSAMYLAYNKAIATEASGKFSRSVNCCTMHSLAYRNTVKQYGLNIGFFNYRNVKEKLAYEVKQIVVDALKEFCLSPFTDIDDFAAFYNVPPALAKLVKKYFEKMYKGEIDCTHDFYMKLFQILMHRGDIEFDPVDILMIDEAGDLSAVTVEVFEMFPAKLKIAVGDTHQNIYGFNRTVNAFQVLKDKGELFRLTQSFRVSSGIASRIQGFCRKYMDPDMVFIGTDSSAPADGSIAYISRTNGSLINKMVELAGQGIQYNLVRSPDEIFRLPIILCTLKYQGFIRDPEYRHIQRDVDEWHEDPQLQLGFRSVLLYLAKLHDKDIVLINAIRTVITLGSATIFATLESARTNQNHKSPITLATAHSVKGLEYDTVQLLPDLDSAVNRVIESRHARKEKNVNNPDPEFVDEFLEEEIQELNLYYVACSRAKRELKGSLYT